MYETVAQYYDALHKSLTVDIGYVLALAGRVGAPVLECGCGTGRILLPLARAGFVVTGIDSSPAMLQLIRQKLRREQPEVRQQVRLILGDMTDFALPEAGFKLAVVSYNTLLHLNGMQKRQALHAIHRHLQPGGMLFLDLANPHALAQTPNDLMLSLEQVLDALKTGEQVLVFARNHLQAPAQTLQITWIYDRSPAGGGPVAREVVTSSYHYLYAHEVDLLLADTGFTPSGFYGDYRGKAFSEDSERLLVLATRA